MAETTDTIARGMEALEMSNTGTVPQNKQQSPHHTTKRMDQTCQYGMELGVEN